MRIPFDLIAAILCAERIGAYLDDTHAVAPDSSNAYWVWPIFLAATWLAHEIAGRLMEKRTRYGQLPDGGGVGIHPQQFHARCTWVAQFVSVALFAGAMWYLKWPLVVAHWPQWFGLNAWAHIGNLPLSQSAVVATLLTIGPYLAAMILSWVPRRRLAVGLSGRLIPLFEFLSFEAKLTLLPLSLSIVLAVLSDIGQTLPKEWTAGVEGNVWEQTVLVLCLAALSVTILMPLAAVKMWECTPMQDGELKTRLTNLLARSGVKARAILVWGGRGSGMLNACVIGPWSRFRYVLISPLLAEELSADETEAVLAHELGHARYGHMTFYLVVMMFMMLLLAPFDDPNAHGFKAFPILAVVLTMGFVIGYIYFFFGALSRQCEREADLASAELIGTPAPLISALEKIAERNGNIRAVPCWHHGSIAERVDQVARLSGDPGASTRFHARQRSIRIGLIVFTVVLLAAQLIFHVQ